MSQIWLTEPYVELPDPGFVDVPQPGNKTTRMANVEYTMAVAVQLEIRTRRKFLYSPAEIDPQDRTPAAVKFRFVEYAKSLTPYSYSRYIMPPDWDPKEAGNRCAEIVFEKLKGIPVNRNDPDNSNNVYDAWVDGTGHFYNGWAPGTK